MGGTDWENQEHEVPRPEIAQELVLLYQKRITTKGRAFNPDTPWQQEMEQSFPFQKTWTQSQHIKRERRYGKRFPMDRSQCVVMRRIWATEILLRAALKQCKTAIMSQF